jgi:glycine/D-amino acid oxidase-like deaminating enzyme
MEFDYDVVIIGGAFSGAATALMIKRKHPAARVLIVEKNGNAVWARFTGVKDLATGYFGRCNVGWRELYDGFVPDFRVTKLLREGLLRWWKAELTNLRLTFASPAATPAKRRSAMAPAEA